MPATRTWGPSRSRSTSTAHPSGPTPIGATARPPVDRSGSTRSSRRTSRGSPTAALATSGSSSRAEARAAVAATASGTPAASSSGVSTPPRVEVTRPPPWSSVQLDDGGAAGGQPVGAVGEHDAGHGAVVALQQRSGRGVAPEPAATSTTRSSVTSRGTTTSAGSTSGRVPVSPRAWGQPRAPVPRAGTVVVGHHPEEQVGGPVGRGRLEHEAAGHGQCRIPRSRDAGDAAACELQSDGRVRQAGGRVHRGGHLGGPAPRVAGNGWRPADRSGACPERQPVGVGGSPFPEVARRRRDRRIASAGSGSRRWRRATSTSPAAARAAASSATRRRNCCTSRARRRPTRRRCSHDPPTTVTGPRRAAAPQTEAVQHQHHDDADHRWCQRRDDPDRQRW